MLSKSFIATIYFLASITSINAHAGVSPALGVKGQLSRNDVQRPSANSPCGNVNIANNLDSSTPVPADANGNFSPSITDFNPGADGSRSIQKVQVDVSGTGKNFVTAKMVVNGNANPTSDATEKLTAQLPPGTKCAGGTNNNLCLVSLTTTAGFGNCVVVSQGAGASKAPASRSFPNGAAKGVNRSADSRAADDGQTGQNGEAGKKDEKKKKGNGKKKDNKKGKDAKKAKDDKVKQDKRAEESNKKAAKDDKKNGKKGKDNKKGKGAQKKKGDKKVQNAQRSWSSRQMGDLHDQS